MKPVHTHSEADAELLDAMDWYDERRPELGKELMLEVQQAIDRLELNPGIGARYRNGPYRFYRVNRFPYVIYYEILPDMIWVSAIAHERRKPGYWRHRKPE